MSHVEFKPDKLSPGEDRLFLLKHLVEFRENTDILVKEIVDQENQLVLSHFETDLSELREYLDAKRAGKELRPVVCCQSCLHHDKGENECESWNCCKLLGKDVYDEFFCGYGKESFA